MERILCAAIWYEEINFPKSDVLKPFLPRNINKGIVFCGWRHPNCLYQMVAITGKYQCEVGKEIQGFLTSENRFVNRQEAFRIAKEAKQILRESFSSSTLYSEDLY